MINTLSKTLLLLGCLGLPGSIICGLWTNFGWPSGQIFWTSVVLLVSWFILAEEE